MYDLFIGQTLKRKSNDALDPKQVRHVVFQFCLQLILPFFFIAPSIDSFNSDEEVRCQVTGKIPLVIN